MTRRGIARALLAASLAAAALAAQPASAANSGLGPLRPKVDKAVAFDVSAPLRDDASVRSTVDMAQRHDPTFGAGPVGNRRHSRDGALQTGSSGAPAAMPAPLFTFEGPSNEDNFDLFGFRVNPPDPDGDVGPQPLRRDGQPGLLDLLEDRHAAGRASRHGHALGGFPIDECTEPSGDPIVLYDEKADRWILTQFTTRGLPPDPPNPFYNCVAVSVTGDPTGAYYRYAFTTDDRFPDYPKYGVWPEGGKHGSVTITTREFADQGDGAESIGIYALNRSQLIGGRPRHAR